MWTVLVTHIDPELELDWEQDFATEGEAERFCEELIAIDLTIYSATVHRAGQEED